MSATVRNGIRSAFAMGGATAGALFLGSFGVENESIIMVFLLGVLFTAVLTSSRGCAIGAALLSAVLFNYLFTEPFFSFFIYSPSDLILLLFFLVTGIVSGTVTSRLQREMVLAGQSERTAKTLYLIAAGFLPMSGKESVVKKACDLVREHAGLDCEVRLDGEADPGGYGIPGGAGPLGRLVLSGAPTEGQLLIVRAVCTQLGIALERENLVADREKIRLAMEKEQQRGTLLRSVAHDLRSPLTALSGAGNLLSDNYDELSDAERRKLAADISEETLWLAGLVENILNMTRISEHKMVLHKQDEVIDDVIGEAIRHTERLLRDRAVEVRLPDEVVTAPMDGRLILQVLINLLENAARHTPPGTPVTLTVKAGDGLLTVAVADTGPGIPPSIRPRLFERFVTKDDGIADGRRGLGLGLSICKAIVEAHGGELCVSDNRPVGAIFTFTLPLEEHNG
ncbi:MAG TPA: ATP-binding protein [Terriglobales bacterium]|nr:ATP-binding protein [Terriglobales bacterium]